MSNIGETLKKELDALIKESNEFLPIGAFVKYAKEQGEGKKEEIDLELERYQSWYTKSLLVVKQLLPDRAQEFEELYRIENRKEVSNPLNYTISDYYFGIAVKNGFNKLVFEPYFVFINKVRRQISILKSARDKLDTILADITGILRADIYDNEIDAAKDLLKAKYLRAAGAVAGVVLEGHLKFICKNHSIKIRKKKKTISDYNEALKKHNILDIPNWRWIQRLADIRTYCCHKKERDPTFEEVNELINGVDKAIKTIF